MERCHVEQQSFNKSKEMLTSTALLVHYHPTELLVLSCDATRYRVRAVLSHVCSGEEQPVAYASKILNKAKGNYSQLEKRKSNSTFWNKEFSCLVVWQELYTLH